MKYGLKFTEFTNNLKSVDLMSLKVLIHEHTVRKDKRTNYSKIKARKKDIFFYNIGIIDKLMTFHV